MVPMMDTRTAVDDPFVRPAGAQRMLGIGRSTLYRLVDRGELPRPVRITPGAVGWRFSVIESYRQRCERAST